MKRIIMIAVLLMVTSGAMAWEHDPWTTQDTILQSTMIGLTIVDLMQTYTFLYKDTKYEEANPFMSPHPSKARFYTIGGGWIILSTEISYLLPSRFRTIWQTIWITDEINSIHHNYVAGIKIKF